MKTNIHSGFCLVTVWLSVGFDDEQSLLIKSAEQSTRKINVQMAEYTVDTRVLYVVIGMILYDTECDKDLFYESQV